MDFLFVISPITYNVLPGYTGLINLTLFICVPATTSSPYLPSSTHNLNDIESVCMPDAMIPLNLLCSIFLYLYAYIEDQKLLQIDNFFFCNMKAFVLNVSPTIKSSYFIYVSLSYSN